MIKAARWMAADARRLQIAALSGLLAFGYVRLGFDVTPLQMLVTMGTALSVQAICSRAAGIRFSPESAFISSLSLCLLLRVETLWLAALAAALMASSKFLIRWNGKHLFNPANFGLVIAAFGFTAGWVSPGQWGAAGLLSIAFIVAGLTVAGAAGRLDSAFAFLGFWALILFGRALWLGDPMAIPMRQIQSGAILLFSFFMITDPMTTPNARFARLIHAALVAGLGGWIVFETYRPAGPILALFLLAPVVPLLDRLFPGSRAVWRRDPRVQEASA